MLYHCSSESQHHSRFRTWSSLVHRHCCGSTSSNSRVLHFQICRQHIPGGTSGRLKFLTTKISHRETWASTNDVRLNRAKSKELVSSAAHRGKRVQSSQSSPPCPNIEHVTITKVLGITVNDRLSASDPPSHSTTSFKLLSSPR